MHASMLRLSSFIESFTLSISLCIVRIFTFIFPNSAKNQFKNFSVGSHHEAAYCGRNRQSGNVLRHVSKGVLQQVFPQETQSQDARHRSASWKRNDSGSALPAAASSSESSHKRSKIHLYPKRERGETYHSFNIFWCTNLIKISLPVPTSCHLLSWTQIAPINTYIHIKNTKRTQKRWMTKCTPTQTTKNAKNPLTQCRQSQQLTWSRVRHQPC